MKKITNISLNMRRGAKVSALLLCAGLLNAHSMQAGTASAKPAVETAQEDETYSNWINLTLGGPIVGGDKAQFRAVEHTSSNIQGGIEDMHYEKALGKTTQLTIDGHAIFDNSDYKVKIELSKVDVGYIRAGYTQFRTWYDGNGGYLPSVSATYPNGQFFGSADNGLALDRGDIWVEIGLRIPDLPEATLRYDHTYRYGQKDSTEWGTGYFNLPNPVVSSPASSTQRKVTPSFYDINETRDVINFDVKKTVFGNTDLGIGMRYEYNKNNDSLNEVNAAYAGTVPYSTSVTAVDENSLNLYDGHFSTVTRFNDSLWLTTAYSYSSINSDVNGLRLTSSTTQSSAVFDPLHPLSGMADLTGGTITDQQVINLSVMWTPIKDLTVTPALRVGIQDAQSNAPYLATGTSTVNTGTNYLSTNSNHYNEIEQSLDIRYTGIDNILLYARGNWDERVGSFNQLQTVGLSSTGNAIKSGVNITGSNSLGQNAAVNYLQQKYALGANWYPLMNLNFALQYYYQVEQSDFSWANNNTVNGGVLKTSVTTGVINAEQLITNDVNARVTWRPCSGVSLVTRYDMQYRTIDNTGIGLGQGNATSVVLGEGQSAKITNNIFSESLTWTPLPRLYIQGNGSYVLNATTTPASSINPSVLNFNNNYYEMGCDLGFVVDDKTDLHASYNYLRACDYQNNVTVGMPYGAGTIENSVSVGVVRKLTKNISMSLSYSYICYSDQTSGYNNNYTANVISSGLQFKF